MSAAKRKGTQWEVDVRDFINARSTNLSPLYRPAQEGFRDTGDLHGAWPFTIQCKDWRDVTGAIREGLDGARKQAVNAGTPLSVAVVKRARKPVAESYVVMTLEQFVEVADLVNLVADERGLYSE